ncbi:EamA family transporter [Pontibacter silvestris]|uniref:EamA family transporter n=1 Tax=Pontibacter silvestris TaxID=2305183 RepID=A0ABW4WUH7_9BACT|nr:EamA family transporter [Pontibacter silvestris]MCC9136377.1 EamA family transporter [Pontibacter silvestris]
MLLTTFFTFAHFYISMETTNTKPYYAAGIAAFVIWGFLPIPLKALSPYASGQILYFRIATSMFILLFISLFLRRNILFATIRQIRNSVPHERRRFVLFTFFGGALQTINWLTFIYVINHINIQTGSFSYLLCPIMTAVLGFLLLKEPLRKNQWIAIGLSSLSCVLVGSGEINSLLFSLIIGLSYALYLITQRILKAHDKIVLLTLQLMLSFTFIAPFYSYFKGDAGTTLDLNFFLFVFLIGAFFTVLPLFLNLYALKELTSGTIGILMYINPIINFVVAFIFFKEETTPVKVFAYVIIFVSVIIYNLNIKGKRKTGEGMAIPTMSAAAVTGKKVTL